MTTALHEGKHKELQENLLKYLKEGNSFKRSMELAGYSKQYIKCHWSKVAENVNFDAIMPTIRKEVAKLQLDAAIKGQEWIHSKDLGKNNVGAKIAIGLGKIHLEEKTPTSLHFTFQTVQQNVDNSGPKSVREDDNNVDNSQLIDITEESE